MNQVKVDVLILGSGPAGLQAAIHAARKKVKVLVLGRQQKSSAFRAHIENYCCISGASGEELLEEARGQAEKSGALLLDEDAIEVSQKDRKIQVKAEGDAALYAEAYPMMKKSILTWGDLGRITLPQILQINHWIVIAVFATGCLTLFSVFEKKGL